MKRRAIVCALSVCALSVLAASAASSQTPGPTPTPDRLIGNPYDPDDGACVELMREPKKPAQVACYATGTITRFGEVVGTTATCEDASANEKAAKCMRGQTLKTPYVGYEGPFCAAVLFDVRPAPNGSLRENDLQRRIHVKEVYPCAGRAAPPRADTDVDFVPGTKPRPLKFAGAINGACLSGAKATDTKVFCFARAGVGASGRANVAPAAVCSDPKLTDKAMECIQAHRLNKEYQGEPPKGLCLQIQYFGKKLFEKGGPAFAAVQLPSCPQGFF
jgi:hypothetical protein